MERKQKDGGWADGREMEARRDERKGEPTKKDGWSNCWMKARSDGDGDDRLIDGRKEEQGVEEQQEAKSKKQEVERVKKEGSKT